MRFELARVHTMPKELRPGVLYVAEEFGAAAHLCACGCGVKVRTPLGPVDWTLIVTARGPTIRPSIGNWQFPCQSHYWIVDGTVLWSDPWTPEEIAAGRNGERLRAQSYFEARADERARRSLRGRARRLWNALLGWLS